MILRQMLRYGEIIGNGRIFDIGSFGLSDTVWEDLGVIIAKQAASLDK